MAQDPATDLLAVNAGEFTASVVMACQQATMAGRLRWRIRLDAGLTPNITVAIRTVEANRAPLEYYVLP